MVPRQSEGSRLVSHVRSVDRLSTVDHIPILRPPVLARRMIVPFYSERVEGWH
jgi:hypothetical protein